MNSNVNSVVNSRDQLAEGGEKMAGSGAKGDTLQEMAMQVLARNVKHVEGLQGVPEEIVLELFKRTIELGKLDEDVLETFLQSGHESVRMIVEKMEIRPLPPKIPFSSNPWLGEGPKY